MFVFLLLNFNRTLYTLLKSDLSDVHFANIFSQSVACLIILLILSFTEHTFLVQIKSYLSIRSFPGGSEGPPCGSDGKESTCRVGDLGSVSGFERSPGVGNGNILQYSCLENSMDREACWVTVHGVTKSQTLLSSWAHMHLSIIYYMHCGFPVVSKKGSLFPRWPRFSLVSPFRIFTVFVLQWVLWSILS